jgi:glycyl-tRNA synthetase beta chain
LLTEPAELALRNALDEAGDQLTAALRRRDLKTALAAIASLRPALEKFFTEVRVNVDAEALRDARLSLLSEVRERIFELADISMVTVKK